MRIRSALAATAVLASGVSLMPAPADAAAGASCSGYTTTAVHTKWAAFAGHWAQFDFKYCSYRPKGFIGPVKAGIRGMSTPVFTHPSSGPFSYGETIKTIKGPYHVSTTATQFRYRVVVEQGHVATPGLKNQYTLELQVRRYNGPVARVCYAGRSGCSKWEN